MWVLHEHRESMVALALTTDVEEPNLKPHYNQKFNVIPRPMGLVLVITLQSKDAVLFYLFG